jgi:hypothetical protein
MRLQLREPGDMSSDADHGNSNHEQVQQSEHGSASGGQGRSGEGAASALAHMIQQDQKNRRESGDTAQDAARG